MSSDAPLTQQRLLKLTLPSPPDADVVVAELAGRMDAEGVRQIQEEFDQATGGQKPVLVDLSAIAFMDSLGIALLVRLAKRLRTYAIPMAVIPGPGPVAHLLGVARVDRILNVVFTRDDAWKTLGVEPSVG